MVGRYKLEQFHFHWGANDDRGSEHAIDGRHFPMEVNSMNFWFFTNNNFIGAAADLEKQQVGGVWWWLDWFREQGEQEVLVFDSQQ